MARVRTWAATLLVAPIPIHFLAGYAAPERMPDFLVYRSAGQSILAGRQVYEFLTGPNGLPFVYTPFGALLMVPPALLPALPGQVLWALLAIYLPLAVTVALIVPKPWRVPFGVAACYLGPMMDLVRFGQIGMLLAALCVADCLVDKPRWPRGTLIGLAAAIKLIPAIFIVHLWVTGRRRAAGIAAGTAAGVTATALLILPGDSLGYWLSRCFDTTHRRPDGPDNQSLLGLLMRAHLPPPLTALLWAAALAAVTVPALRAVRRLDPVTGVAVTGLLSAMLSPITWSHHLVWIVVVLAALLRRDDRLAAAVVAFCYLPASWVALPLLTTLGVPPTLATATYGLGALALLVLLSTAAQSRTTLRERVAA
jgi:alpha-1,2-mannosyltransferase